ncbi:PREDICTED: atrophin-1-like isoform X1 [Amphimedon queenslandica]|uniref:ETS domain-containing protein n=1 Tax=Amphimedon queenslandica TaxID=400682 RepID=A0AAN0JFC2_AMPQE|nr:PREDICTED: atrophin-1-like isoform X1 [Amphimedon queenslandica]|eukprot:XP_019855482.1 PREDICTED: atrophin-1-like isoform X1 [Amphimedon queenslandica]
MATALAETYHSLNIPTDPTIVATNLWLSSPPPPPPHSDPTAPYLSHQLSPISPYQTGSTDNLTVDIMNSASPHHHGYSDTSGDGAVHGMQLYRSNGHSTDYTTPTGSLGCTDIMTTQQYTGERSPDSGSEFQPRQSVIISKVYSPTCHSPSRNDYDPLPLVPTCTGLVSSCSDYLGNEMLQYSNAATIHPPHPAMSYSPSHYTTTSMNCDIPCQPMYSPRPHPYVDSGSPIGQAPQLPMGMMDQTTATCTSMNASNPIQFYPETPSDFYIDTNGPSPPCFPPPPPPFTTEDFIRPHHPPKPNKRPRKPKPPATVDPSEIKDIPASAQLWEFLLKVLKKPKYAYMVSWENQQDGLFRFHDPPAFAALWGRHRNRPSMTYDKVARALRYYYRRDILEQVGGRLTYKFSPRLCKQFSVCSSSSDKTSAISSSSKTAKK